MPTRHRTRSATPQRNRSNATSKTSLHAMATRQSTRAIWTMLEDAYKRIDSAKATWQRHALWVAIVVQCLSYAMAGIIQLSKWSPATYTWQQGGSGSALFAACLMTVGHFAAAFAQTFIVYKRRFSTQHNHYLSLLSLVTADVFAICIVPVTIARRFVSIGNLFDGSLEGIMLLITLLLICVAFFAMLYILYSSLASSREPVPSEDKSRFFVATRHDTQFTLIFFVNLAATLIMTAAAVNVGGAVVTSMLDTAAFLVFSGLLFFVGILRTPNAGASKTSSDQIHVWKKIFDAGCVRSPRFWFDSLFAVAVAVSMAFDYILVGSIVFSGQIALSIGLMEWVTYWSNGIIAIYGVATVANIVICDCKKRKAKGWNFLRASLGGVIFESILASILIVVTALSYSSAATTAEVSANAASAIFLFRCVEAIFFSATTFETYVVFTHLRKAISAS